MSLVAVAVFVIVPGNEVETVAKTLTVTGCASRAPVSTCFRRF
jgi:hypothetical protein